MPANWFASGEPEEYALRSGDSHIFEMHLESGWYLEVDVEQLGIDVVLHVFGPHGEELTSFDSPTHNRGTEIAFVVTENTGMHRFEVHSFYQKLQEGRYRISLREYRKSTPADRHKSLSQTMLMKAARLDVKLAPEKAFSLYDKALSHARLGGYKVGEARAWNHLAEVHKLFNQPTESLAALRQALLIWRALAHREQEITVSLNIGVFYTELGETEKGLRYLYSALDLSRSEKVQSPRWEGDALQAIGQVYQFAGDFEKGLFFYQKALDVWRAEEIFYRQVRLLHWKAGIHVALGQDDLAWASYEEAIALGQNGYEPLRISGILLDMAMFMLNRGQIREAAMYREQAIEHWNETEKVEQRAPPIPPTLYGFDAALGKLDEKLGKPRIALDRYYQSLEQFKEKGFLREAVDVLGRIALLERDQGRLRESLAAVAEATEIIETQRQRIAGDRFQALFRATRHGYYELWIDLLMRLHQREPHGGYAEQALEIFERSRARSLLESDADHREPQAIDPRLLERERTLSLRLEDMIKEAVAAPKRAEFEDIDLLNELEELRARIRTPNPESRISIAPKPVSLGQIQGELLGYDTVFLAYALGQERSFLWVVTRNSFESFILPSRTTIEHKARRVYTLLTARAQRYQGEMAEDYSRRILRADEEYPIAAAELSRLILAPAGASLQNRRILVVADGILQSIPFSALPMPNTTGTPLIDEYEVVTVPSMSALDVLRRRSARANAPKTLAVVADPILSDGSPVRDWSNLWGILPLKRTACSLEWSQLGPLPGTRAEANTLLELLPSGSSSAILGQEASRQTVLSGSLKNHSIVHFATHACVDKQHPNLSGILLSLYDEEGYPQDGVLRLNDVYDLALPADLVVLSACQTALGQEIQGEGLIGFTRAFLYAGARAVVASLWNNDDQATAALMERFYRLMLKDCLSPADALRRAQQDLRKEKAWQAPYFWAPFVVHGDSRLPAPCFVEESRDSH